MQVTFRNWDLIKCALTTASSLEAGQGAGHGNKRLQQLGGKVAARVVHGMLPQRYPDATQDRLAVVSEFLLSDVSMYRIASLLEVNTFVACNVHVRSLTFWGLISRAAALQS